MTIDRDDAIVLAGLVALIVGAIFINPWWLLVFAGAVAVAYGTRQGDE